jgi:hypothetical protein
MSCRVINRLSQVPINNIGQLPAVLKSEEIFFNGGPTLAVLPRHEFFDGNDGLLAFAHAVADSRQGFLCCAILSETEFVITGYKEQRHLNAIKVVAEHAVEDPRLFVRVFLTENSIRVNFDIPPARGWVYQAAVNSCLALMLTPRPDRVVLLTFQDKFDAAELELAFMEHVPTCLFSVHKCDATKQVASLWHGLEAAKIYTCE